jgi:hypothetical protein
MIAYVVRVWIRTLDKTDYVIRDKSPYAISYESPFYRLHLPRIICTIGIL